MKTLKPAELKHDPEKSTYTFKVFSKYAVTAAFSSRHFRMNFVPGKPDTVVIAHRKHFCRRIGVPFGSLVYLNQVHGANIVRVGPKEAGKGIRSNSDAIQGTDASMTNVSMVPLSVHTADCGPVYYFDPKHRAIGLAHVGWRGAEKKLAGKMIQAFRIQFLSNPKDLMIALGPMIRSCCYQVGAEFAGAFGEWVLKKSDGFYFDLPGWILNDLKSQGVVPENIHDSGICTACENDKFPSYRKEGVEVRHMLSVMMINE